jgi:hypothetical protein
MKKASFLFLALIAMFGLVSCELITSMFGGTKTPTSDLSDWKVKGSFDGWTLHQFTIDAANAKLLSYSYTGLANVDYEFVVVDPAGVEHKYNSITNVADNAAGVVMGTTTGATAINLSFTALKTSYTIKLDITTAATPSVTLVPGATTATPYTFAELAAGLKIKGDQFWSGAAAWTEVAGTSDSTAKTVTWTGLAATIKAGSFGFSSLDGFLKGVSIAAPSAAGTPTTAVNIDTTGNTNNATVTGIADKNDVYSVVVTIDPTKSIENGKYKVSVSLTTLVAGGWPRILPANIYFVGALDGITGMTAWDATDAGRKSVAVDATTKKAALTFTPATANWQKFKFALEASAGWAGLIGYAEIDQTNSTGVSDDGGNMQFQAATGTAYTVTADFTTYVADGKIVVKLTHTP